MRGRLFKKKYIIYHQSEKDSFQKQAEIIEINRCYWKCVLIKYGWMDEEGNFNQEGFAQYIPKFYIEAAKKSFENCMNVEGSDTCEKASLFWDCFSRETRPRRKMINN